MNAGHLGRADHGVGILFRVEAGDVLGDGAGKQLDVLRQIAEVAADRVFIPLVEGRAIEADGATVQRPDAGERPDHRGLARAAGADDADGAAGLDGEAHIADQNVTASGRAADEIFDTQLALGCRQGHRGIFGGRAFRRGAAASSPGWRRRRSASWRSPDRRGRVRGP